MHTVLESNEPFSPFIKSQQLWPLWGMNICTVLMKLRVLMKPRTLLKEAEGTGMMPKMQLIRHSGEYAYGTK